MIEYEHFTPQDHENRASFYERMTLFPQTEQLRLRMAYDLSKYSHRGTFREGGERYFEHVRNTALIILDDFRLGNTDMIITALLHDSVEDATIFGSHKNVTNSQWRREAGDRLTLMFGPYVSEMVMAVTKPMIDGVEIKDKEDVKRVYLEQLRNASPEAIVVKIADRLHNLSTLQFRSHEDQVKVARETLDDYLPIFREKSKPYSEETWWALAAMEDIASQYLDDDAMEIRVKGELVQRLYQINLGLHHQDLSAAV